MFDRRHSDHVLSPGAVVQHFLLTQPSRHVYPKGALVYPTSALSYILEHTGMTSAQQMIAIWKQISEAKRPHLVHKRRRQPPPSPCVCVLICRRVVPCCSVKRGPLHVGTDRAKSAPTARSGNEARDMQNSEKRGRSRAAVFVLLRRSCTARREGGGEESSLRFQRAFSLLRVPETGIGRRRCTVQVWQ